MSPQQNKKKKRKPTTIGVANAATTTINEKVEL